MVKMYGAALNIRHKLKDGTELITRGVPLGLAIGVYIDELAGKVWVKLTFETI